MTRNEFIFSMQQTWHQLTEWLSLGLIALVFLLLGFVVPSIGRKIIIKILKKLRVEELSISTGVDDFLVRGGIRFTVVS